MASNPVISIIGCGLRPVVIAGGSGSHSTLEWMQEIPQALTFKPLHGTSQSRTPNGPGTLPMSTRSTRLIAGHPERFVDGFASNYSDAAEAIANSVIESSNANSRWNKC